MSVAVASTNCPDKKDDQQHKSAWFQFIKSIATFKGDLTSLTAPPFLLAPQSIVEYSTYWAEHPRLFVAPASEPDPARRALLVLQWFLSTLRHQHASRDDDGRRRKLKPLNPFLGEVFVGKWVDDVAGTTELVSEQVSHHPPATAYRIWNEAHGVELEGVVAPKSSFSSTINIERRGYNIMHIARYAEDHVISMPRVHVEGLVTLQIAPELNGTSYIRSSSGYTSRIEYSGRGWLRGRSNGFVATLYRDDDRDKDKDDDNNSSRKRPLYTLEGRWSEGYTIKENNNSRRQERGPQQAVEVDLSSSSVAGGRSRRTEIQVPPLEKQHPLESRRAWQHVARAIRDNDVRAVGHEKSKIENAQRALRRSEKAAGKKWEMRYFSPVEGRELAERLAVGRRSRRRGEGVEEKDEKKKEKGEEGEAEQLDEEVRWKFDKVKYEKIMEGQRRGVKSPTHSRFDSGVGFMADED
ncbi:Oxysterol-binding protein [Xylariomycetidae sp. FL2044]|nr:Oxysterol-binding protein [Xylariomycetidae sp. FL2044]